MFKVISFIKQIHKQNKKTLLKGLFLFLLGFAFLPQQGFLNIDYAYADSNSSSTEQDLYKNTMININILLGVLSRIGYVLLWPLVALAGLAMDNNLIYGSFMNLDVPLWKIWQITRNFANYALGIIFLLGILAYNLSPEGKPSEIISNIGDSPKEIIRKTLIAGVLIQASRFIMMVLVDLSTILTYSLGGIPNFILHERDSSLRGGLNDTRMFQHNIILNLGDTDNNRNPEIGDSIVMYRSAINGGKASAYIAPCSTITINQGGNDTQSFVVGRAYDLLTGDDNKPMEMVPGYCMQYGNLINFNDFYVGLDNKSSNYNTALNTFIADLTGGSAKLQDFANLGIIFPISIGDIRLEKPLKKSDISDVITVSNGEGSQKVERKYNSQDGEHKFGNDDLYVGVVSPTMTGENYLGLYNDTEITIGNIMNKTKSMTGPFVSLYASLSTFSHLTETGSLWQQFITAFINALFSIMLFLPLVALVLVLFARVGILWLIIALSPFIVLINVYDKLFGKIQKWENGVFEKWNIIRLLLAPVFISFAVSISLIFMTALKNGFGSGIPTSIAYEQENEETAKIRENLKKLGFTYENNDLVFLDFIKIKLNNSLLNISWLITMIFGIGVTWFLLFWAIKTTTIGNKVGGALQGLGENILKTTPIIPLGDTGLSWNTLTKADDFFDEYVKQKVGNSSDENLRKLLGLNSDGKTKGGYNKARAKEFIEKGGSFTTTFGISTNDEILQTMTDLTANGHTTGILGNDKAKQEIINTYSTLLQKANSQDTVEQISNNIGSNFGSLMNDINGKVKTSKTIAFDGSKFTFKQEQEGQGQEGQEQGGPEQAGGTQ